jgi:hypothetical protein
MWILADLERTHDAPDSTPCRARALVSDAHVPDSSDTTFSGTAGVVLNNPLPGCRKRWLRVLLIPLAPFLLSKACLFWLLLIGDLAIFGPFTRSAVSGFECHRLLLPSYQRAAIFLGRERPVQRGFGDLQRPAYLRNRVALLIEILGNT